jgi:HD-like signal output (HDOD) protein
LARQLKLPVADEAFLAGLIHDVGILVWLRLQPESFARVCEQARQTGGDFCQIEMNMLGADHQMLGMALAEAWRFPRSCQLVAGYHHRPMSLAEENRVLPSLVFIADTLSCQGGLGFNLTALNQRWEDVDAEQMAINSTLIHNVAQMMPQLTKSAEILLD